MESVVHPGLEESNTLDVCRKYWAEALKKV